MDVKFKGIDVSKWQGSINWAEAKSEGVEFAIIREGYGKESPSQVDKKFKENYSGAKYVGIPSGVYHYSYADSVSDAKYEAEFCLKNIRGLQLEYPVCFDIEDKEQLKLDNRARTDICKAFCEEIEKAGYYAMIYCNLNWWNNYLIKEELAPKYDLWLAQWGVGEPSAECGIWQHSETGIIGGISGNVDLNKAYRNYPQIMKMKGLNGFSPISAKSDPKITYTTHTVQKGESLWVIAQRLLGEGSRYPEIKKLNGLTLDLIQVGQVLKIPNK